MAQQIWLFSPERGFQVDPALWQGGYYGKECTFHQLAPYVGKMKSAMAAALVQAFSRPREIVLDPFCGSGVVLLESLIHGRGCIGNDLNPYAYVMSMAKVFAPATKREALAKADDYITQAERRASTVDLRRIPEWVRKFFHPQTLKETYALNQLLLQHNEYFLLACLMGILHHVRPGFLSYPASHLVPYLRIKKYPTDQFPEMYQYRGVRSRLLNKIDRMYARASKIDPTLPRIVLKEDTRTLSLPNESVDAIISSPPYFDALDYGRDNRLRLWFLGVDDYKVLDQEMITDANSYLEQMSICLKQLH